MAKEPIISIEQLRKVVSYDPNTGELYWLPRSPDLFKDGSGRYTAQRNASIWNRRFAGKRAFNTPVRGYPAGGLFGSTVYAHTVAYALYYGEWPKEVIDHINGDILDNRIENLRAVSQGSNCKNQRVRVNNTSGVLGVNWIAARSKWRASIMVNRKGKFLGEFDSKAEAIAARKGADAEYGFHANHGRRSSKP